MSLSERLFHKRRLGNEGKQALPSQEEGVDEGKTLAERQTDALQQVIDAAVRHPQQLIPQRIIHGLVEIVGRRDAHVTHIKDEHALYHLADSGTYGIAREVARENLTGPGPNVLVNTLERHGCIAERREQLNEGRLDSASIDVAQRQKLMAFVDGQRALADKQDAEAARVADEIERKRERNNILNRAVTGLSYDPAVPLDAILHAQRIVQGGEAIEPTVDEIASSYLQPSPLNIPMRTLLRAKQAIITAPLSEAEEIQRTELVEVIDQQITQRMSDLALGRMPAPREKGETNYPERLRRAKKIKPITSTEREGMVQEKYRIDFLNDCHELDISRTSEQRVQVYQAKGNGDAIVVPLTGEIEGLSIDKGVYTPNVFVMPGDIKNLTIKKGSVYVEDGDITTLHVEGWRTALHIKKGVVGKATVEDSKLTGDEVTILQAAVTDGSSLHIGDGDFGRVNVGRHHTLGDTFVCHGSGYSLKILSGKAVVHGEVGHVTASGFGLKVQVEGNLLGHGKFEGASGDIGGDAESINLSGFGTRVRVGGRVGASAQSANTNLVIGGEEV